jgi:nicotinate phosphoribosyltransferase
MSKFIFDKRIKSMFYSANYFIKTTEIIEKFRPNQITTMQFFQRSNDVMISGIKEVIELLNWAIPKKYLKNIKVMAVNDGTIVNSGEAVLIIEGKYQNFGFLEGIIDGILCRRTTVTNNAYQVLKIIPASKLIYMSDRNDDYNNQIGDGYAASVAGITNFVTQAHKYHIDGKKGIGTMPHALIQQFNGDIIEALKAYHSVFPDEKITALVDYNNDCINDAISCLRLFSKDLYAVRVDTSFSLVDKSLQGMINNGNELNGVNPTLIKKLRKELDENNGEFVKIIVSSGFDLKKIIDFEKQKTPVDIYGVGSYFQDNRIGFTADCVMINGREQAKVGRKLNVSSNIKNVKMR